MTVAEILDFTLKGKKRLRIVETGGCRDTLDITRWMAWNVGSSFDSVSLDSARQEELHHQLEELGLARFCTFRTTFPKKYLADQSWIDVIFLNGGSLSNTLDEFLLAVSAGTSVVILRNYSTEAALAIASAKNLGWLMEAESEPFIVLRRPYNK